MNTNIDINIWIGVVEIVLNRTYYNIPLELKSSTHKAEKKPHQQMGGRFAAPHFAGLFSALCVELYQSRGDKS